MTIDLATHIVDTLLKTYGHNLTKLFVNSQYQKITVYRDSLFKITKDIYIQIFNKDGGEGQTRWPQLKEWEFRQIADQTFKNLPRIIRETSTSGPKGSVTQLMDQSDKDKIVFTQPVAYHPIFMNMKTDWIANYNKVLKTYNASAIRTVDQTARTPDDDGVSRVGAFTEAANLDTGGTAEEQEFRRRMQQLHMDVSTIASARASAVIATVSSFVGANGTPLVPGDIISSITAKWIPGGKGTKLSSKGAIDTTLGTNEMNVVEAGARDWDMKALREALIVWTNDVISLEINKGKFEGVELNGVRNKLSKLFTNKISFGIDGATVTYKELKVATKSKSKKKNFKKSKTLRPPGPPTESWQRGKKSKQLSSKAGEIMLELIAGLRGGEAIREKMGPGPGPPSLKNNTDPLNYQNTQGKGRDGSNFAKSVVINDVNFSRVNKRVSVRYDYNKKRYGTFEPGYGTRGLDSKGRDPHRIISETIREIAKDLMVQRGFTRLGLGDILIRRPIS